MELGGVWEPLQPNDLMTWPCLHGMAMFTRDQIGTIPNQTGQDQLLSTWNHLELVQVFARDWSETDPNRSKIGPVKKQVQFWIRLDPFPIRFSDRIHLKGCTE